MPCIPEYVQALLNLDETITEVGGTLRDIKTASTSFAVKSSWLQNSIPNQGFRSFLVLVQNIMAHALRAGLQGL